LELFERGVYFRTLADYSAVILCTIVFLAVFELLTKYRNWDEIKNGNLAVALATGGKIFGIANIFRVTLTENESLPSAILQGAFGFLLLMGGYFIFEFLTPSFNIDEEIKNGNKAVGWMAMMISIGLSYVIGAGLSGSSF